MRLRTTVLLLVLAAHLACAGSARRGGGASGGGGGAEAGEGDGRAVYLDFQYNTSDAFSAISHEWGRTLLHNAVAWSHGCR